MHISKARKIINSLEMARKNEKNNKTEKIFSAKPGDFIS